MCVRSSFPRLNDKFLFIFQLLKDIFQRLASLYPIPSRSRTCDTSLCLFRSVSIIRIVILDWSFNDFSMNLLKVNLEYNKIYISHVYISIKHLSKIVL